MLLHFKKSNEILETWSPHCKNLAFKDPPSLNFHNRTDASTYSCKKDENQIFVIFEIVFHTDYGHNKAESLIISSPKFFVEVMVDKWKTWTRDSQYQNWVLINRSKNISIAQKLICPDCLPKSKGLGFL